MTDKAVEWKKASRCDSATCVEIAVIGDDTVGIRSSQDPDGPALQFPVASWRTFRDAVADGDFAY